LTIENGKLRSFSIRRIEKHIMPLAPSGRELAPPQALTERAGFRVLFVVDALLRIALSGASRQLPQRGSQEPAGILATLTAAAV
jgi:hypothetical protein